MGLNPDHHRRSATGMDSRELDPAELKRIPERDVSLRDIRWLAAVDIDRASLEGRWGRPEAVRDSLAEWVCFAFSPVEGEAFSLQREVDNPPTPQFGISQRHINQRSVDAKETS
jgi:hypothetical protein